VDKETLREARRYSFTYSLQWWYRTYGTGWDA